MAWSCNSLSRLPDFRVCELNLNFRIIRVWFSLNNFFLYLNVHWNHGVSLTLDIFFCQRPRGASNAEEPFKRRPLWPFTNLTFPRTTTLSTKRHQYNLTNLAGGLFVRWILTNLTFLLPAPPKKTQKRQTKSLPMSRRDLMPKSEAMAFAAGRDAGDDGGGPTVKRSSQSQVSANT